MNFDFQTLVAGGFFGIIGYGAWRYGRKQGSLRHMLLAVSLMAFPYFIDGLWPVLGTGSVLGFLLFWPRL